MCRAASMSRTCARSSWNSATRSTSMPFSNRSKRNTMPSANTRPAIGGKLKNFSAPVSGGGTWSLKDLSGKNVVLYFYPKDMTSGCTKESQDFRDLHAKFRKAGVDIVGVSRDSVKSHAKFVR